jgi:hypothetical protein
MTKMTTSELQTNLLTVSVTVVSSHALLDKHFDIHIYDMKYDVILLIFMACYYYGCSILLML